MNEENLIKLLKENFPTKKEFGDLVHTVNGINEDIKAMKADIKVIQEDIDEIKPSIKSLDKILEQHPIERIERLEVHNHLPSFNLVSQEE